MKGKHTMHTGKGIARPGASGFPTPVPEISGGVISKSAKKGETKKSGAHGGGIGGLGKASHPVALGHNGKRHDHHQAVGFSKKSKKK